MRSSRLLVLVLGFALLAAATASPVLAREVYFTQYTPSTVSVVDTATNSVVGSPISVGSHPSAIAITPDGRFAYVTNYDGGSVSVIDTQSKFVRTPIPVGTNPTAIAISPDGRHAYVGIGSPSSVVTIDTQSDQVVGSPIPVGNNPQGIAVTPDGRTAYVTSYGTANVSVIDTQTDTAGPPIPVGGASTRVAVTPDGHHAYVDVVSTTSVAVIDTGTNQVVGSPIPVGSNPLGLGITPDGKRAYVVNNADGTISVIDTQTNAPLSPIDLTGTPIFLAITPDGGHAYVTSGAVGVLNLRDDSIDPPILLGSTFSLAIVPDQGPIASFSGPSRNRPGVPVALDGSASSDPDGTVGSYDWEFGDGSTAADGGAIPSHTYARPGTYTARLTVTDNEGCSTELIFTGQTAYCNGSAAASTTQPITVAYPGVRVKCPKSAKPKRCLFRLQAFTKKRKGKAESKVATTRLKAGRSAIVSLVPKRKYAAKLARAIKIEVKQTLKVGGKKRVSFRKLKVVR